MFCKHKWEIIESYKFENELKDFITGFKGSIDIDSETSQELAKRGLITIVKCSKCSKVKHKKTVL